MVMGEENFTAKAQRAQRKQLMLTGVECSPRRREGREEGVHAYGWGETHRKGAKSAKKSRLC